jgi:hypothetical protein
VRSLTAEIKGVTSNSLTGTWLLKGAGMRGVGRPRSEPVVRMFLFLTSILGIFAPAPVHAATRDFAALVDVGGGRKMYLECRGSGSPTVVLVSGLGVPPRIGMSPTSRGRACFPRSPSSPGSALTTVQERRSVRSRAGATRCRSRPRRRMRWPICIPC